MQTKTRQTTLLELVQAVQDTCRSDAEVIAVILHMVKSRRVVLGRSMARRRIATA